MYSQGRGFSLSSLVQSTKRLIPQWLNSAKRLPCLPLGKPFKLRIVSAKAIDMPDSQLGWVINSSDYSLFCVASSNAQSSRARNDRKLQHTQV
jgi:hypothetical protein